MVTSDPVATINAAICVVIVGVLMFYRKKGARHRPWISHLAYLAVLVYASIPFAYLCGIYAESHWMVALVNLVICVVVLRSRGNVAKLVDALRLL